MPEYTIRSTGERAVQDAIAERARQWHWEVREEPVLGNVRPDLLLTTPAGESYVIEVKTGPTAGHFGSVAQVAGFRDAAENSFRQPVRAILLVVGQPETGLAEVGHDFGVEVMGTAETDPSGVAEALASYLQAPTAET